jgi:methyltransferase (TIGR00027 family)
VPETPMVFSRHDLNSRSARPPSISAISVTFWRAISFFDHRSGDSLAWRFLPEQERVSAADPEVRNSSRKKFPGLCEFITARTRFMDDAMLNALAEGVKQVVILGAGFDSRAYRFPSELLRGVRIFEVDHPVTQSHKRDCLQRERIDIPKGVEFVALDLNLADVSLGHALGKSGFDDQGKSLWLCEGISYYLEPMVAVEIMKFISRNAPGTTVAFDYLEWSDETAQQYGVPELLESWREIEQNYPHERLRCCVSDGQIENLMLSAGLLLRHHVGPRWMEASYHLEPVAGCFWLAQAEVPAKDCVCEP